VLRSKCVALLERAGQVGVVAAKRSKDDVAYWDKFRVTDHVLEQVTRSLPSIYEEPRFDPGAPHIVSRASGKTNPFIIFPHLLVCDAAILLHKGLSRAGNVASRDACLKAAWRAMHVVRKIQEQKMGGSVIPTLVPARIFQVFADEHYRLCNLGDLERARILIPELKILSSTIREQAEYFPLAKMPLSRLKKLFPSLRDEPGLFST